MAPRRHDHAPSSRPVPRAGAHGRGNQRVLQRPRPAAGRIGIFGVASYTVAQRTNELGIRMALGAGRWSVIRESMRETMLVFAVGLSAGIVAAIVAVRLTTSLISNLLCGLTPTDATSIAPAVTVMTIVALTACVLPARRATRFDSLTAIRCE